VLVNDNDKISNTIPVNPLLIADAADRELKVFPREIQHQLSVLGRLGWHNGLGWRGRLRTRHSWRGNLHAHRVVLIFLQPARFILTIVFKIKTDTSTFDTTPLQNVSMPTRMHNVTNTSTLSFHNIKPFQAHLTSSKHHIP